MRLVLPAYIPAPAVKFDGAADGRISIPPDASINNLNPWTTAVLVHLNSLTGNRMFSTKFPSGAINRAFWLDGTAGDVRVRQRKATTNTDYTTNDTPLATIDRWYWAFAVFDDSLASPNKCKFFSAQLGRPLASSTFGTTTDGSGALYDDSGDALLIGNRSEFDLPCAGDIALFAQWGAALTLEEAQIFAERPEPWFLSPKIFGWLSSASRTFYDQSGNGNDGTPAGTLQEVYGPPIPILVTQADVFPAAAGAALVKVIGETVQLSEDQVTSRALNRVIADTLQLPESLVRARLMTRVLDETVQMSETIVRSRVMARILGETVELPEGAVRSMVLVRVRDETVEVAEAIARALGKVQVVNETLEIAEATVRALGKVAVVSETLQLAEAIVRSMAQVRIRNETIELAEAIVRSRILVRVVDETESLVEQILRVRTLVRMLAESLEVPESVLRTLAMTRVHDETVQIPETLARSIGLTRVINETIAITESIVDVLGAVVTSLVDVVVARALSLVPTRIAQSIGLIRRAKKL